MTSRPDLARRQNSPEAPTSSKRLAIASVALLLTFSLLPAPASAARQNAYLTTFGFGNDNVTFYAGSCNSTLQNVTTFRLPWDANVSFAGLYLSTPDDMTGKSGWVQFNVGDDSSFTANTTLDATSNWQWVNLTADSWFQYISGLGATSGTISVPLGIKTCAPAGGWNLMLANLNLTYNYDPAGGSTAPFFVGPIPDVTISTDSSVPNAVLAANYFDDPDAEVLTYSMVKLNLSDAGWSNVAGAFTGNRLGFAATNNWTGNLTFYIKATDSTSQSATSNNITLRVVANRPPAFSHIDDVVLEPFGAVTGYVSVYDPDGGPLRTELLPVDANDSAWGILEVARYGGSYGNISAAPNLTYSPYSALFLLRNNANWTGSVKAFLRSWDIAGRVADSNPFNITGNRAPLLEEVYSQFGLSQGQSHTLDMTPYFSDAEGDLLTYFAVDLTSTNATTVPIVLNISGSNLTTSFWDTSWSGVTQIGIYACDAWSRCTQTRVINVTVYGPANQRPLFSGTIDNFTLAVGGSVDPAFNVADYFSDPDNDTLYFGIQPSDAGSAGWNSTMFNFDGTVVSVENNATTSWTGLLCFRVYAEDLQGGNATSNEVCINIVNQQNAPPMPVGPIPDQSAPGGSAGLLALDLSDYISDDAPPSQLTFTVLQGPEPAWASVSLSVEGASLRITFLAPVPPTDLTFAVRATDAGGASYTSNVIDLHIAENPTNRAPTLGGALSLSLEQGASGTLDLGASASDPDGDAMMWTVAPAPSLVVSISAAGVLSVSVPLGTPTGTYTLIVTVTDGWGAVRGAEVALQVVPEVVPLPDTLAVELNGAPTPEAVESEALEFAISEPLGPGVTVQWYVDGTLVGAGRTVSIPPLPAGQHTVEARISNGAEQTSINTTFTVRPVAPPVTTGSDSTTLLAWTAALLSLAMVGAFVGLSERGRYFVLFAAFGSVFARLKRDSLLDHFVRGRLYQAISDTPGIHLAELRRRAKVGHGTAIHHLRVLEKGGYIKAVPSGSLTRFYPTDQALTDDDYGLNDSDRAVLSVVAEAPGITQGDLSARLERSPSTVSRSVSRLVNLGYVTTEQKGRNTVVFPRPGAKRADDTAPGWAQRGQ